MRHLEAEFELVTPAFCGGADNKSGPAEIRLPSILGQLRWWWRALAWSRTSGSEQERLEKIHGWEQTLFGSADTGQGAFVARLNLHQSTSIRGGRCCGYEPARFDILCDGHKKGIAYCAGQGLSKRAAASVGATFSITVREPPRRSKGMPILTASEAAKQEPPSLVEALWAWGLIGGLGSRQRRGFGSIALRSWNVDGLLVPGTVEEYSIALKTLCNESVAKGDGQPPISAFSPVFRMAMCERAGPDVVDLHGKMGQAFLQYRNCYRPLLTHRFKLDHDWFYKITGSANRAPSGPASMFHQDSAAVEAALIAVSLPTAPERAIFGLPHNYSRFRRCDPTPPGAHKEHHQYGADVTPAGQTERRASPLVLHIHSFPNGTAAAVWSLFEAKFLPDDHPKLSVMRKYVRKNQEQNGGGWSTVPHTEHTTFSSKPIIELPFNTDYAPARDFMTTARLGAGMKDIFP